MVEVVTGAGVGLERTSGLMLGAAGTIGSAATGTAGVSTIVNAKNGNLVLQSLGEVLDAVGEKGELDAIVNQTYNSLGQLNGINGTTWAAQGSQIVNLVGTLNAAGSSVQRIGWEGSVVTYNWSTTFKNADGTTGAYIAKENAGTDDSLTSASGVWSWHEGATGVVETYGNPSNRVSQRADYSGNLLTFTYTGSLLTRMTTRDGEYVDLIYTGNNLTQLTTHKYDSTTLTRTYYGYDSQNRLTSTTVDLSPNDNSITDGKVYTTTYSYFTTTNLVQSVTQTDGSRVDFTYDGSNRVATIVQWATATASRTTSFTYNSGSTTVTDPLGNQTVMGYDANGNLTSVAYPAVSGGSAEYKQFTYDTAGNLLTASVYANVGGAPSGAAIAQVTNSYDANGNLLSTVDLAGNTTTYTYNLLNEVLAKTVYTVPAVGATPASGAETTYYAYGAKGVLRFTVSPTGDVTYRLTNALGQTTSAITYTTKKFSLTGFTPATPPTVAQLQAWQATLTAADNQATQRTDYTYDPRGNLVTATGYTANDTSGNGLTTAYNTVTTYVYDSAGNLLSRLTNDGSTTATYVYDGLGRITLQTDPVGNVTSTSYNDTAHSSTETFANGLVETQTFDRTGELTGTTDTGTGIATTTTSYIYDADGNLRVATDPAGTNSYYFYDADNRKTGEVDGAGYLTAYKYDAANRLIATVTYATPLTTTQLSTLAPSGGVPSSVTQASITPTAAATDNWTWTIYDSAGRVAETINAVGTVSTFGYDGTSEPVSQTIYATQLTGTQLSTLRATPPTATILPATSADDRTTRSFYDADGRMIGALDAEGYLTQIDYDAAGQKVATTAYATQAASALRASGTFAQLQTSVGTSAQDEHSYFLYEDRGFLAATIDPLGNVVRYTHVATDQVDTEVRGQTVTPNTAYTLATLPAATGTLETTHYTYDGNGRVLTVTQGQGSAQQAITTYHYDGIGDVTSILDARGFTDSSTYDVLGRVLTTSVAIDSNVAHNLITSYTYDTRGNKTSETDPNGHTSYFYYDADDRLTLTVDPLNYATRTTYNLNTSQIASVVHYYTPVGAHTVTTPPATPTNLNDATTLFTYDAAGRLIGTTDALGSTESYGLNAFGDRIQFTNKRTAVTLYTYDHRGSLLSEQMVGEQIRRSDGSVVYQSDGVTQVDVKNVYLYDAFGNRTFKFEGVGVPEVRSTTYTYDALNRLKTQSLSIAAGVSAVTTYTYDTFGNLVQVKDPNNNATNYYYDALNRKAAEVNALGVLTSYAYDGNGNVTTTKTYATPLSLPVAITTPIPTGTGAYRETDYAYDGNNRLIQTSVPNVTTGTWNGSSYVVTNATVASPLITSQIFYDGAGNVIRSVDGNGNSSYFYYDAANQQIATVDASGYLTTEAYDQNGNVSQENRYAIKINVGTLSTTYGVPVTGLTQAQLTGAAGSTADDRITQFTYDKNGNRLTETRLNVAIATPSTTSDAITQSTANATITYVYNVFGEVKSKTEATGDATTYQYDNFGRLTLTSNAMGATTTNYYDALNNVVRTTSVGTASATRATTYSYDGAGRLVSMTGPGVANAAGAEVLLTTTYGYDLAGNLILQSQARDAENPTTVNFKTAIAYDALNRAISEQSSYIPSGGGSFVNGDVNGLVYDAFGDVAALTINGTRTTQSVYDTAGHLVASNSGDGTWKAYITDGNGNVSLTIQTIGTTDLGSSSYLTAGTAGGLDTATYNQAAALALATNNGANTAGAAAGNGVVVMIGVFDGRNQQSQSLAPQRQIDATATRYSINSAASYNAFGEVASRTDERGYTTSFAYNTEGKLTSQISPQVSIASGNGTTVLGNPTQYSYYDLSGRLVATRDADGNLMTHILLAGSGYGGSQALETAEFHADNGIARNTFDVYGDVLTQTDALGYVTTNGYDDSGHLIMVQHPARATNTDGTTGDGSQLIDYYRYDGLGEQVAHWNSQFGNTVRQTTAYDAQGRVIATSDYMGRATTYSYQWSGALATTGLGTYGGWKETINDVASGIWSTDTTDAFGHEIAKTDAGHDLSRSSSDYGGHVFAFGFNKAGELISQTSTVTSQSVTTNGTTTAVNTGGQSLAYTYFNTGKIATIVDNSGTTSPVYTSNLTSTFSYDVAGNRLTSNYTAVTTFIGFLYGMPYSGTTTTVNENLTATYDALNRVISASDPGTGNRPSYSQTKSYDAAGNIIEDKTIHQNIATNQSLTANTTDDYWYAYDSMNRVVVTQGVLSGTAGAVGTHVVAGSSGPYDPTIVNRTNQQAGTALTYNADGEQTTASTSAIQLITLPGIGTTIAMGQTTQQSFAYTADGYLATTSVAQDTPQIIPAGSTYTPGVLSTPVVQARDTRDALGRVIQHTEYNTTANNNNASFGTVGTQIYSAAYTYDNTNLVLTSQTSSVQYNAATGAVTDTVTNTTNSYGTNLTAGVAWSAGAYTQGNVVSQTQLSDVYSGTTSGGGVTSSITVASSNSYLWFDGAEQASITSTYSGFGTGFTPGTTTSTFYYDHNGHVSQVSTTGSNARTNYYTTSAAGLIMAESTYPSGGGTNAPETFYFYLNDRLIGQVGNNPNTTNSTYTQTVNDQTLVNGTGPFYHGSGSGTPTANFDQNFQAINAFGNGEQPTGSSYSVQNGDTLAIVAQKVFGDSSLWYVIANANGLSFNSSLVAGQTLSIPNVAVNTGNTSSTFKPYNANAALGDVQPGAPVPPSQSGHGGCGVIGTILQIFVAVAVAVFAPPAEGFIAGALAGAATNAVEQGIGILTGAQKGFNFGELGLAALTAGVSAEVGASSLFDGFGQVTGDFLRGVTSSVISQGVGVALGLQRKFNFAGVAAAGIAAAVGGAVSRSYTGDQFTETNVRNPDFSPANAGQTFVTGMAGAIASAATSSALGGGDFGDNLLRGLPQVIGFTIGTAIQNRAASQADAKDEFSLASGNHGFDLRVYDSAVSSLGGQPYNFGASAWTQTSAQLSQNSTFILSDIINQQASYDRISDFKSSLSNAASNIGGALSGALKAVFGGSTINDAIEILGKSDFVTTQSGRDVYSSIVKANAAGLIDFKDATMDEFGSASGGTISINSLFKNEPAGVVAAVLAHEGTHLYLDSTATQNRIYYVDSLDEEAAASLNEARAYVSVGKPAATDPEVTKALMAKAERVNSPVRMRTLVTPGYQSLGTVSNNPAVYKLYPGLARAGK